MAATLDWLPLGLKQSGAVAGFMRWLRTHRGAIKMAGLFSYAAPVMFFAGEVSVMREPTPAILMELALLYLLSGFVLGCLLLVIGYALQRLNPPGRYARGAAWLLGACAAAAAWSGQLSIDGHARIPSSKAW